MLEYNSDGSLKLTAGQMKRLEIEKQSVIITKEQISEKPAKAQIRIRFPEDLKNPQEIINFYHRIQDYQFRSVEHSMEHIDGRTFIVKVDSGSMLMYGLLNFMTDCFRDRLSQTQKVVVKGSFAKSVF